MGLCTITKTRCVITIIFVLVKFEVCGCHHVRTCNEDVRCLEDEKIRLDRFVNVSRPHKLEELRLECNRRVTCEWAGLGCEYKQYTGMTLEYSCIEDLVPYQKGNNLKSGTVLSPNYPNHVPDVFHKRLEFPKNVTLNLTFHDIGFTRQMLYLTVYSLQHEKWIKYNRLVGVGSKKSFTNSRTFDISLDARRLWITYTITEMEDRPPVTIRHCPDNDKTSTDCPPAQMPPVQMPTPKSTPKPRTWLIYTGIISCLSTIILVVGILYMYKRFSSMKSPSVDEQKCEEQQRPDILTHFPSDGNIITGDILAHEMEAAAAEAESEEARNRNNEEEEQISHYETITVPHYTDFPQRPRPSLPDLPLRQGVASCIAQRPRPSLPDVPPQGVASYIAQRPRPNLPDVPPQGVASCIAQRPRPNLPDLPPRQGVVSYIEVLPR